MFLPHWHVWVLSVVFPVSVMGSVSTASEEKWQAEAEQDSQPVGSRLL